MHSADAKVYGQSTSELPEGEGRFIYLECAFINSSFNLLLSPENLANIFSKSRGLILSRIIHNDDATHS